MLLNALDLTSTKGWSVVKEMIISEATPYLSSLEVPYSVLLPPACFPPFCICFPANLYYACSVQLTKKNYKSRGSVARRHVGTIMSPSFGLDLSKFSPGWQTERVINYLNLLFFFKKLIFPLVWKWKVKWKLKFNNNYNNYTYRVSPLPLLHDIYSLSLYYPFSWWWVCPVGGCG